MITYTQWKTPCIVLAVGTHIIWTSIAHKRCPRTLWHHTAIHHTAYSHHRLTSRHNNPLRQHFFFRRTTCPSAIRRLLLTSSSAGPSRNRSCSFPSFAKGKFLYHFFFFFLWTSLTSFCTCRSEVYRRSLQLRKARETKRGSEGWGPGWLKQTYS